MIDIERSATPPSSLARGRSYRDDDVRRALHMTFLCKCYLCETPIELGTFTIDHRKPQADARFSGLKYAWDNLFPACAQFRCNERREKIYPDGGLLNPGEGVEVRLIQRIERTVSISLRDGGRSALVFRAQDPADVPARNAAQELDRLHNGTGSVAAHTASSLRTAILEHVIAIAPDVYEYERLARNPAADAAELEERRWRVAKFVSRRAPYAMLVRSYFAQLAAIQALFD